MDIALPRWTSHAGARHAAAPPAATTIEHRAAAAALTVLLHVGVVLALVRVTTRVAEPPPVPRAQQVGADRLRVAGERIVPVEIRPGPAPSRSALACAGSTYVGVGITADPRTERIILVGDDTPASRAGLRHDDIVLNPEVWRDAHRDGALLRVLVLREGGTTMVEVRVGWICIG